MDGRPTMNRQKEVRIKEINKRNTMGAAWFHKGMDDNNRQTPWL